MKSKRQNKRRSERGALVILLCFILGLIVLPAFGVFAFETVRACSLREQLRSACEAAALAGAAKLASSDNIDPMVTHQDVLKVVADTFRANTLSGNLLTNAVVSPSESMSMPVNGTGLFIQFLDPSTTPPQPVAVGTPTGRVVRVVSSHGLEPVFGKFLGLPGPYPINVEAQGRVPQLDLVMCFDVSGSIDDQTAVSFIKRYWDNTAHRIQYQIISARAGAPTAGGLAHGRLFDIIAPPATGTGLNAHYPQSLNSSNSGCSRPLTFSPSLRGSPNTGAGPGNYPLGGSLGDAYTYTDLVININPETNYTMKFPFTSPAGFYYPNMAALVEAARGNLENGSLFVSAHLDTVPELAIVTPKPGYQADYNALAQANLKPIGDAQIAAREFFTIMNTNTEAHFGFVSFSSNGSGSESETFNDSVIASNYGAGGTANYAHPSVNLDKTQSKFSNVLSTIPNTRAHGNTNIGDALSKAKQMLITQQRPSAKRAIILFTDGQPTAGGSDPWSYARQKATEVKNEGISIYSIGLAQNDAVIPGECNILNDDPTKPISYVDSTGTPKTYTPGAANPGVSYIAGNNGKFFLVTNSANLRLTFENIARQLVQLVPVSQ